MSLLRYTALKWSEPVNQSERFDPTKTTRCLLDIKSANMTTLKRRKDSPFFTLTVSVYKTALCINSCKLNNSIKLQWIYFAFHFFPWMSLSWNSGNWGHSTAFINKGQNNQSGWLCLRVRLLTEVTEVKAIWQMNKILQLEVKIKTCTQMHLYAMSWCYYK